MGMDDDVISERGCVKMSHTYVGYLQGFAGKITYCEVCDLHIKTSGVLYCRWFMLDIIYSD